MKTTMMFRSVLIGSGALALLLGLLIWAGMAPPSLGGLHVLAGDAVVLALWILAGIAARSGVTLRLVLPAALWGVAAFALGGTHGKLVPGDWHWVIQVLHVATAMGMIAWGRALVTAMLRNRAGASAAATPADGVLGSLARKWNERPCARRG